MLKHATYGACCRLHVACCMAARRLPGEFSLAAVTSASRSAASRNELINRACQSSPPTVAQQLEVINDLLRIAVEPRADR